MPRLFGRAYTRRDLMRRVGDLSQVAGIRSTTLTDGWARGVRTLEVRTGSGLRYDIMLDRGADIGLCEVRGRAVAWMPPMRFPGPWFYDPREDGWLRTGLGGPLRDGHLAGAAVDVYEPEPPVPEAVLAVIDGRGPADGRLAVRP